MKTNIVLTPSSAYVSRKEEKRLQFCATVLMIINDRIGREMSDPTYNAEPMEIIIEFMVKTLLLDNASFTEINEILSNSGWRMYKNDNRIFLTPL